MKKSKYTIRIPLEGMILYYNSFTDQYLGLSLNVDKAFTRDDWEKSLNDFFPKQLDKLRALGFIIDDDMDELAHIRFQNKMEAFNSRDNFLMVYPTQDCNLKCWYCYESHVANSLMNQDIQSRILKMIQKRIDNNLFDSLKIAFFGGEPLINFNEIAYPLSIQLKKIITTAGKRFQSFFVTNATLITPKTIDLLKEINPYFQITLDGNREKHNSVRIRKIGSNPTYDDIIHAIKLIVDNIYNESNYSNPIITLRINYDNNTLRNISELIADLGDIKRSSIYIHLERVWQTRNSINDNQRELLVSAIRLFVEAGFYVGHGCFGKKRVSCPAESESYMIVNYDGNLFRCNGRTLTHDTREGYIDVDGTIIWNQNKRSKRMGLATFENDRCLNCVMLPRCMGPCSQKLFEHNGFNDSICTISGLDVPLEEYLKLDFEIKYALNGVKINN